MKIINLYAENLKRLTAVQISPDGNLVQITGLMYQTHQAGKPHTKLRRGVRGD